MNNIEKTLEVLEKNNITYDIEYHDAVYTMEEAKKVRINLDGVQCKNLFLKTNEKDKKFYLYVLHEDKRADLKKLAVDTGIKKLSFANPDELMEKFKLTPGSVTPLGIINDFGSVTIILDESINQENILVHPNSNLATIRIKYEDLIKLINIYGNNYLEYKDE